MASRFAVASMQCTGITLKLVKIQQEIYEELPNAPRNDISDWITIAKELKTLLGTIEAEPHLQDQMDDSVIENCLRLCFEISDSLDNLPGQIVVGYPLFEGILDGIFGGGKDSQLFTKFLELEENMTSVANAISLSHYQSKTIPHVQQIPNLSFQEARCMYELRGSDPAIDREQIISSNGELLKGTCEWILVDKNFKNWLKAASPHPLWISATPGTGKTYLAVFLTQHLQNKSHAEKDSITIFFFCDGKINTRNTGEAVLRGLIFQLIQTRGALLDILVGTTEFRRDPLHGHAFESLWRIFEHMIRSLGGMSTVYCVIDAVDECDDIEMNLLIGKFRPLIHGPGTSPIVRLAFTNRKPPRASPMLRPLYVSLEMNSFSGVRNDASWYLTDSALKVASGQNIRDSRLRREIEEKFQQRAEGTFLWVKFMTQEFEQKRPSEIEASLISLPWGLKGVYNRALFQVDLEKLPAVIEMLRWITFAKRPLTVPELCEALKIESATETTTREAICLELVEACGHLLQVTKVSVGYSQGYPGAPPDDGSPSDESGSLIQAPSEYQLTVTFSHQSAKDYILDTGRHNTRVPLMNPQDAHASIANRLMEYLAGGCLEKPEPRMTWDVERHTKYALADYAIDNWNHHFGKLDDVHLFLKKHDKFFKRTSNLRHQWVICKGWPVRFENPIPLLHLACFLGLSNLAKCILSKQTLHIHRDINKIWITSIHLSPLEIACIHKDVGMVRLLLSYGADPRGAFPIGCSALAYCIEAGSSQLFSSLTGSEQGAELLRRGEAGNGVPDMLHVAACQGDVEACELLIEKFGWSVEANDSAERTPLICAVESQQMDLARMLVSRWNANTDDHWLLLTAACNTGPFDSDPEVFPKMIAQMAQHWNVDINVTCDLASPAYGQGIVHQRFWSLVTKADTELLLSVGLDIALRDEDGNTLLHSTNTNGWLSVMKEGVLPLLLQDGRLDINATDHRGYTMLHTLVVFQRLNTMTRDGRKEVFRERLRETADAIKLALDFGASRSLRTTQRQKTPMQLAIESKASIKQRRNFDDETESAFESSMQAIIDILEHHPGMEEDMADTISE